MARSIAPGERWLFLRMRGSADAEASPLAAWVDTAFTGDLTLPRSAIERLGLTQSAAVMAGLADGTRVVLETYTCLVEWFGADRAVEVVKSDGQFPLLGVGPAARPKTGDRFSLADALDPVTLGDLTPKMH